MFNQVILQFFRKIVLFTLLIFTLYSCANKGKIAMKNDSSQVESNAMIAKISAKTKLFLADYRKELKATKHNLNSFAPSKDLIEKYSLVLLNDNLYYAKGFATFDDKMDIESLSDLGIKIGSKLGSQTSLNIPLNKFETFLQLPHISYFEIAEKATLKK